ncbi:MAG: hypothetical protein K0R05_891 [Anaerocolumna sp.]|nr:hypothetical protein [Anaerocolumna sp.]
MSVKENLLLKGCHTKILSHFFISGTVAGIPALCSRCSKFVPAKASAQIRMHKMHVQEWRKNEKTGFIR